VSAIESNNGATAMNITSDQIEAVILSIVCNEPRHQSGQLAIDYAKIDVAGYMVNNNVEDSRENIAAVRERMIQRGV
jgi:uncharacterized membrane protein